MTSPADNTESLFTPDGGLRAELLGDGAAAVLQEAARQAEQTNWDAIRTPHIFMGLLAAADDPIRNWGERIQADLPKLLEQFRALFRQQEAERRSLAGFTRACVSEQVVDLLGEARRRAAGRGRTSLTPIDLLIGVLTTKTIVAECFERIGIPAARLIEAANLAEQEAGNAPQQAEPQRAGRTRARHLLIAFAIASALLAGLVWYYLANPP